MARVPQTSPAWLALSGHTLLPWRHSGQRSPEWSVALCDCNFISTGKRRGPLAPMTGRSRFVSFYPVCLLHPAERYGAGFLRDIPFSHQSLCHLAWSAVFELLAFGFAAERGARASIDNLVQFVEVLGDPSLHRRMRGRCSRKRGVKGRPRISLIGRLGLLV